MVFQMGYFFGSVGRNNSLHGLCRSRESLRVSGLFRIYADIGLNRRTTSGAPFDL